MTKISCVALLASAMVPGAVRAEPSAPGFEIYGFGMVDYIQDFKRMPGSWDATLRPTKIPEVAGAAGGDGQAVFSARQSRLGARGWVPAGNADLKGRVEFDFFGRGGASGRADAAGPGTNPVPGADGGGGPRPRGPPPNPLIGDDSLANNIRHFGARREG